MCRCMCRCRCRNRFRCTLARKGEDGLKGEVRGPCLGREGGSESACRCRFRCRCSHRCRCRCRCRYRFRCTFARQGEHGLEREMRDPGFGRKGGTESTCRCRAAGAGLQVHVQVQVQV